MNENIIILFFFFNISFCYYSLKLRRIYLPAFTTDFNNNEVINTNIENNTTINLQKNNNKNEEIESEIYDDIPLNKSELNKLNESYIKTKNIKLEAYTTDFYLGSNKQYFRLLLSTSEDYITVAGKLCRFCNVSKKYNFELSNNSNKLNFIKKRNLYLSKSVKYAYFQDSLFVPSQTMKNNIPQNYIINITKMNFKVIESDKSGFLNSDLYDGILALNYYDKKFNNNFEIRNSSFIQELYKEGKISSPSFSVIITPANINRLYLGNIMKNDYIKNYVNTTMNKGKCKIITNNNWICRLETIEYKNYVYSSKSHHKEYSASTINFNLKQNKLIIPDIYYELIVVGWRWERRSCGKNCHYTTKEYDKWCNYYDDTIYCTCGSVNDFGLVTFHFENNSTLDIDLRNYIYYNKSAFFFHCKVDIELSKNNEFVIGLRGLNNTILSFDMEQKIIEFFHKRQTINYFYFYLWLIFLIFLLIIYIVFEIYEKK